MYKHDFWYGDVPQQYLGQVCCQGHRSKAIKHDFLWYYVGVWHTITDPSKLQFHTNAFAKYV